MKIKGRTIHLRWLFLATGLIYVWLVMSIPGWGEWYARNLYPLLATVLSRFSSWFPFSVGDCFIYGSIAGLLIYWIVAFFKRYSWKRVLGRSAESLLWVYLWMYMGWCLNYFRADFFTRSNTPYIEYSDDAFRSFLSTYTDSLNASFIPFAEVDKKRVAEEVKKGYGDIAGRFGMMAPTAYLRAKPMLIPSLMSGVGILGYMGPFFTEYNLNPRLLPVQYPFTYAHEMAHVLGISNEAEANLYGFLVCSRSESPEIHFSAYMGLLPYVLENAYMLLPENEFNAWRESISPEVKDVYNTKVAYWQSLYSPTIGELQATAYNLFLKGNNIPSGRKNYSEVVALLMAISE